MPMRGKAFWLMILLLFVLGVSLVAPATAQTGVRVVVVNEFANVRIIPAIGADVIATVPAGTPFNIVTARNPDGDWLRVDFNGNEGWVNIATLTVLEGDIAALPVADPRTIPFGGFEAPRAGMSSATSNIFGTLRNSGVRLRAGPSTGYPVLANIPRFAVFPVTGRTLSNEWIQINYEGTLGWIVARVVQLDTAVSSLPVNGVIADSPPLSDATADSFVAVLRLMLDRLDLAQPTLDEMRRRWTDSALTGRASCQPYPARPSDFNVADDILAAFYPTLNPLVTLFNDAMFNTRKSVDLFIEVCNQPGTGNPVGQATVIGALQTIGLADSQYAELRQRITALIPPDREIGEDECLFTFQNRSEILPVIVPAQIYLDSFTPARIATGYCIDILPGQNLLFETLQKPGSNIVHQMSISPFDNPTNFIAVGSGTVEGRLLLGPVLFTEPGRYLIVLSNIADLEEPLQGEFALFVSIATGITGNQLNLDENGEVILGTPAVQPPSNQGQVTPDTGAFPNPGGLPPTSTPPGSNFNPAPGGSTSGSVCTNIAAACEQLVSCEEAYACLNAGNFSLDPDDDGIPCEILRCPSG